jgi:hypothetical protein
VVEEYMVAVSSSWRKTARAAAAALALAALAVGTSAQQSASIRVDADDIGGVVTSGRGPEAGVWVIAETSALPTKFRKIVVTDDKGQFVIPDLPRTSGQPYKVWVRGYGLVDSAPVDAMAGRTIALQATPAPTPKAAAEIYPANYWYSLMEVPPPSDFPGTGPTGNGISPRMTSQADWISQLKDGCQLCHQMGNKATREIPAFFREGRTSVQAWEKRLQAGQRSSMMSGALNQFGRERALKMFADWSDRIAAGEVPPQPPRPQGLERNVVLSQWDWGNDRAYIHDEVATDKRNPTINPNGKIYGVDLANDLLTWVDPTEFEAGEIPVPVQTEIAPYFPQAVQSPSAYYGEDVIWKAMANPHNPMMDHRGRVWMTSEFRPSENPQACKSGKFGEYFPLNASSRQASVYDPRTGKVELVDTCFSTHHLQFAEDKDHTLYFSGDSNAIGWINTRVWEETKDVTKAQGWCPMIVDTNADGKIGAYTNPGEAFDPAKDTRVSGFPYGIIVNPKDGSIWWATSAGTVAARGGVPGRIARMEIGSNPPYSCKTEIYEPPFDGANAANLGAYTPRGIDIDRNGVIWTGLAGGPHMGSFDRRKCKGPLTGPNAIGQHCKEGWELSPAPGPQMKNVKSSGSADFVYYNWVDQFNTLGLGENVPIMTGSGSDSLLALMPDTKEWVVLRVPYPLGFYSRGLDGRIDNAKAGWKGRGVWANYGTNTAFHLEGGKGQRGSLVKFQMRPDPLAR